MTRWKWLVAGTALGLALLVLAMASAQEVRKQIDEYAEIRCEQATMNWVKKTWSFVGNVKVTVTGPDKAEMTSPRMTGEFAVETNTISKIVAQGPVRFDITTRPDDKGARQRIVASCTSEATYAAGTKIVTLTGAPEVVISPIPQKPGVHPTTFTANPLTINLKTSEIGGKNFSIKAQLPPETPKVSG